MRLIEPLGLLDGPDAAAAVDAGLARPLAGGPAAFTLARLIDSERGQRVLCPVAAVADDWMAVLERLTRMPPAWAGLPPGRAAVMGIINVTPDSFSDGGERLDAGAAIAAGQAMAATGADILDIGGESTRPGSAPTPQPEEAARVLPVIRALAAVGPPVSIDARNAATMAAALDAGATIVNDVSALGHDPAAAALVAARGCPVVLMHMRGQPATMAAHAQYTDVALEVTLELAERVAAAERAGIARARIAVDPGIGFAKTGTQNHDLLRGLPLLLNLGCPILVGLSRKRFLSRIVAGEPPPKQRGPGSLAGALYALARGARILRVHDVAETVQAVRVWQGLSEAAAAG
jgi:dihydropteroate synthase